MSATVINGGAGTISYYLFDITAGGIGGLQQTIPANALSSYNFTNAFLGRSPFLADNATSGTIDEFRIFNNAQSDAAIAANFAAGPNDTSPVVINAPVPEPATLSIAVIGAVGLLTRRARRR